MIWRVNPEWEETEPKPKIPRREVHMDPTEQTDPTQQQAEPREPKQAESREQKQAERNPKDPDES